MNPINGRITARNAAPGLLVWTLVDFAYGDVGAGPTSVLLAIVLGVAARRSLVVPA